MRDERVHDRPGLVAFRRADFEERRPGRQIEPGTDDEHAADAPVGLERLDDPEADRDDVAGFDRGVGAEAAGSIEVGDGVGWPRERWATNSFS